nr:MAG TPA: hypothetical protein [Caudoviricetes sp.]
MSYTINDLEMIQDFIVRNEKDLKASEKFEALDKLQKEMERDILYQRHIDSGLPRVFMSDDSLEDKYKEFGMMNNMMAILVDRDENVEFEGLKSKKGQITALVINGRDEENNKLNQPRAEFLGEVIIYDALIKLQSSKDIVELALKYRNKNTDYKPTEIISTRPAPKPTVEKEVIDSEKVEKAKAELKTSDVNEAFKEIFGEKDENGNYAELNKFEEDLKKAHNLLGTPSVEETVEKQVEEAKEKDENKISLFGGKSFTFGSENKTDTKPVLKKATKGVKPKFAGFTGTEYMAEDGKVDENGIPLKFANNTAAEEKFGEPAKDGRTSTNIAELIAPSDLRTIFYLDTNDGTLVNYSNSEEDKQQFKHWTVAKNNPNLIIIGNGDIKKANGEKFTPEEWKMLEANLKEYIDNIDNYKDFIPEDSLEVMEIFLDEDVFHNEEEMYGRVYTDEELKAEDPEELERDSIWGSPRIEGSEL